MTPSTPSEIIDALGGTAKVAEICEISPAAVSQWRKSKLGVPKPQLRYLREKYPQVFWQLELSIAPAAPRRATDPPPPPAPDHAMRQPPSRDNVMGLGAGQVDVYEVNPKESA